MPKTTKTSVKTAAKAVSSPKPEKKPEVKAPKAMTMDQLLSQQTIHPPRKGEFIDAKITNVSKKGIIFDIGWKSYAVLGQLESQDLGSYLAYLKEGDVVPVKVVVEEAKDGFPVVSMRAFLDVYKRQILYDLFINIGFVAWNINRRNIHSSRCLKTWVSLLSDCWIAA